MTLTQTYKVHIAGEPRDGEQRCTRCHCKMAVAPNRWPVAALVSSRRGGMRIVSSVPEGARECGRQVNK